MNKNAKILIVEDEQHINRLIELVLISDGYKNILKAFNGKTALDITIKEKPDLILLDVMIPEIDGFSLCKIIKNNEMLKSIPIVMLTARKVEEDILEGFGCGAIDYVTKPFNNKILLARINAHLGENLNNELTYKNIIIDKLKHTVQTKDGEVINLTNFEFELLCLFIENQERVYSRSQLLSYLRGDNGYEVSERAMDVQILNLRRKLGEIGANLETIRGVGYKLKDENNE